MRFAFIAKHRHIWPVAWLCEVLQVSRSGFHAWLNRRPSDRAVYDETLVLEIGKSFKRSDRTYGARRVWRDVLAEGLACGLHHVERLMRLNGFRHPVLAAQIRTLRARLMLLQNADDLLFREPCSLHRPSPFLGRTLIQTGGNSQWQVKTDTARLTWPIVPICKPGPLRPRSFICSVVRAAIFDFCSIGWTLTQHSPKIPCSFPARREIRIAKTEAPDAPNRDATRMRAPIQPQQESLSGKGAAKGPETRHNIPIFI